MRWSAAKRGERAVMNGRRAARRERDRRHRAAHDDRAERAPQPPAMVGGSGEAARAPRDQRRRGRRASGDAAGAAGATGGRTATSGFASSSGGAAVLLLSFSSRPSISAIIDRTCGTSGESGATSTNFWYVARAFFRSPSRRWHCAMLTRKPGSGLRVVALLVLGQRFVERARLEARLARLEVRARFAFSASGVAASAAEDSERASEQRGADRERRSSSRSRLASARRLRERIDREPAHDAIDLRLLCATMVMPVVRSSSRAGSSSRAVSAGPPATFAAGSAGLTAVGVHGGAAAPRARSRARARGRRGLGAWLVRAPASGRRRRAPAADPPASRSPPPRRRRPPRVCQVSHLAAAARRARAGIVPVLARAGPNRPSTTPAARASRSTSVSWLFDRSDPNASRSRSDSIRA